MLIPAPAAPPPLSSVHSLCSQHFLLPVQFLPPGSGNGCRPLRRGDLAIRMGGGPRTYPGGVSKWQWKRMQAKKARQLLKARLARERQLFEMRKRAELRDAVAHLERPWDPDPAAADAAPNLLSVAADDQLKALADRFHRPGGVDLWNDRDGPRVFESPATGATSARFFPKNAVHSVQPYALRGAADEPGAPVTRATAADVLLALGGQGVRQNAPQEEAYGTGDRAPADEFMERGDGTWEPLHGLDDGHYSSAAEWSSDDDDDDVTYESEGTGNVDSWRQGQAIVRRNGRSDMVRWEAANSTVVGRDDDTGWSGDAFLSNDAEEARQGHLDQRWQQRSRGARKHAGERWNAMGTMAGSGTRGRDRAIAGSVSDSEMIQSGSQPKWSKNGSGSGTGRWSTPRKDWISDEFNSNSDSARGSKLEQKSWGAQNKLNGRGNVRGRFKPKYNGHNSDGEAAARHMRSNNVHEHGSNNNGHGRPRFGDSFAEELEAPTWKPRRINRARNSNGGRKDELGGTFRRGDNNGAARWLQANPNNTNKEGGRTMARNRVRQKFRGDDYSLRPTSELHSSWKDVRSDEL